MALLNIVLGVVLCYILLRTQRTIESDINRFKEMTNRRVELITKKITSLGNKDGFA